MPVIFRPVSGRNGHAVSIRIHSPRTGASRPEQCRRRRGRNNFGQLGDGTTSDRHLPVASDASFAAAIGIGARNVGPHRFLAYPLDEANDLK
jgi:hypothetical protein